MPFQENNITHFPIIFGRNLLAELDGFVLPKMLVVTMEDLWPIFGHHFEGAECQTYFCGSIEQDNLNKEAENLGEVVLCVPADRFQCPAGELVRRRSGVSAPHT